MEKTARVFTPHQPAAHMTTGVRPQVAPPRSRLGSTPCLGPRQDYPQDCHRK